MIKETFEPKETLAAYIPLISLGPAIPWIRDSPCIVWPGHASISEVKVCATVCRTRLNRLVSQEKPHRPLGLRGFFVWYSRRRMHTRECSEEHQGDTKWQKVQWSGSTTQRDLVLSSRTMVRMCSFTSPRFRAMVSSLSQRATALASTSVLAPRDLNHRMCRGFNRQAAPKWNG